MTQPTPADELRAAAERLRQHASTGAYTATPAAAALLRAREPLADWLDIAVDYAERWAPAEQVNSPFRAGALAVARAILGKDQT